MKKQVTAAVFRQEPPQLVNPVRYWTTEDGSKYMEHRAVLTHITDVTGTYSECWEQAKKVCAAPVLEFPKAMYRGNGHV